MDTPPVPDETIHDRVLPILRSPALTVIGEFLAALREPYTWNPLRNTHILFGLLWGLPIPVFSLSIDLAARHLPFDLETVLGALAHHPFHFFFLAHPLLFALVFGAMGTVRYHKDRKIERLVGQLEDRLKDLAAANEALKGLDRMKSEFLANVSHELRTPLVSIRGYNEMIEEERLGPITAKQREGILVSLKNVDRLLGLINELLDFSRLQAGKTELALCRFDLREVIETAIAALRVKLEEKGLVYEQSLPAGTCILTGDRDKIGRVALNLLSNAVKFTERGGRVGLEVTPEPDGGYRLRVWDTGCGIPQAVHHKVFERFWQFDGSTKRRYPGTGLGLAIVKEIVAAHGGRIEFSSAEGKGTEMRVWLPAAPPAAATAAAPATAQPVPVAAQDTPPPGGGRRP